MDIRGRAGRGTLHAGHKRRAQSRRGQGSTLVPTSLQTAGVMQVVLPPDWDYSYHPPPPDLPLFDPFLRLRSHSLLQFPFHPRTRTDPPLTQDLRLFLLGRRSNLVTLTKPTSLVQAGNIVCITASVDAGPLLKAGGVWWVGGWGWGGPRAPLVPVRDVANRSWTSETRWSIPLGNGMRPQATRMPNHMALAAEGKAEGLVAHIHDNQRPITDIGSWFGAT